MSRAEIKLIQGDCLERMKDISNGSVDLILTDPPYGTMNTDGGQKLGIEKWDVLINTDEMFNACNRILRKNGTLVLFSQDPYTAQLMTQYHANLPFSYRYTWRKNSFANSLSAKKAPLNYTEDICVFFKNHPKHDFEGVHPLRLYFKTIMDYIGKNLKQINKDLGHRRAEHCFYIDSSQFGLCTELVYNELRSVFDIDKINGFRGYAELKTVDIEYRKNLIREMTDSYPKVFNLPKGRKFKSNVLEYRKDKRTKHPTQKPVCLLEDLIKTYTNKGDMVLDFTMGSGSTLIACDNTRRNGMGIEKDLNYYNMAKNRIEQHQQQLQLF